MVRHRVTKHIRRRATNMATFNEVLSPCSMLTFNRSNRYTTSTTLYSVARFTKWTLSKYKKFVKRLIYVIDMVKVSTHSKLHFPLVFNLFSTCFPLVFHLFATCFPLVFHLFSTCVPFVCHLFSTCFPLVYYYFNLLVLTI